MSQDPMTLRWHRLLRQLQETQDHELSCSECFDQLSDYVDLELAGQPVGGVPDFLAGQGPGGADAHPEVAADLAQHQADQQEEAAQPADQQAVHRQLRRQAAPEHHGMDEAADRHRQHHHVPVGAAKGVDLEVSGRQPGQGQRQQVAGMFGPGRGQAVASPRDGVGGSGVRRAPEWIAERKARLPGDEERQRQQQPVEGGGGGSHLTPPHEQRGERDADRARNQADESESKGDLGPHAPRVA